MMKNILIAISLLLPVVLFSQVTTRKAHSDDISRGELVDFNIFCKKEAIYYVEVPAHKMDGLTISGERTSLENNSNASHIDYDIDLKENETQYFKLIGTDKLLAARSLYSLRLNYANSKK